MEKKINKISYQIEIKVKTLIALFCYCVLGKIPKISTFIDEDTITMGYGQCSNLGDFEYPLPNWVVEKNYGTTLWSKIQIEKQ